MRDGLVALLTSALEEVLVQAWLTRCPVCHNVGQEVPCARSGGNRPVAGLFHPARLRKTVVWYVEGKLSGDL